MSSPAIGAMTVIDERIEATPPPTNEVETYHAIRDVGDFDGESGHRAFLFEVPEESQVNAERGADMTVMATRVVMRLKLSGAGLNRREHVDAVHNEGQLITRRINTAGDNDWPPGIETVIVRRWFTERLGEDTAVRFEIDLITEETD